MPGYKELMHAGLGRFAPDQLNMIQGLFAEKQMGDVFRAIVSELFEEENKSSVSDLQKELQRLEERKELAAFQSRLFELVERDKRGYADLSGYKLDRSKPISQKNKEKAKRRKKNKNKKTHRKK